MNRPTLQDRTNPPSPDFVSDSAATQLDPSPTPTGNLAQPAKSNLVMSAVKYIFLLSAAGLFGVATVLMIATWRTGSNIWARLTAPQPEAQVETRSVLVQQIRGASELTTAVFAMESVVPAHRDRTVAGYTIGTTTLLYIAYGEVRAGVDLSDLTSDDIQIDGDRVTITLPAPEILDSKIDVTRSTVYDYDRGFLGLGPDAAPELQQLAQTETLEKIVETACQENLLQEASTRAELTVTQLLTTAGYEDVTVRSQPILGCSGATPALPPAQN
jgi:hypothetical protein